MAIHLRQLLRPHAANPLLAVLLFVWAACGVVHAKPEEEGGAIERRLKAAFIYKFAAFIQWPQDAFPSATSPFVIGIAGDDPIASELELATAGHTVRGRTIVVQRIKLGEHAPAIHMLFVGKAEKGRLTQWLQTVARRAVLVVTESEGALEEGSVINFVSDDRRVRFDISLASADQRGLKLDSRLLAVAQQVRRTQ